MKEKLFMLFACLVMSIGLMTAQTKKVTGIVTSADDGEPIIGASVLVKGTTLGTITGISGDFTIVNVPASAKSLVVSYVGMTSKEVAIQNGAMKIVLKSDAKALDEVVVTAMGISKEKKALAYATQDIKGDKLIQGAGTDLASAMAGKVSGVTVSSSSGMPGSSSQIVIRGVRSFTGDNTPLYVVDGMPIASSPDVSTGNSVSGSDYANRSLDIDPNDIESINILKGQAASALYGMRASNGVIIITTKTGKGVSKGKPQITFSSNLSMSKVSTVPDLQTEYAQGTGGEYVDNQSKSWGCKISDLANNPTYGGNVANSYTDKYGIHSGQYYVPQRAAAGLDPWATPQTYDNIGDFFETGVSWTNSLNIAQNNDRGNYSFTLGNTKQDGVVPSTGMERYNAKLSASTKLNKYFTTGFNGNFVASSVDKQTGANNGIIATLYACPTSYDLAGIPSNVENDPYTQNNYRGTGSFDNCYWATKNNSFNEKSQRFFGNAYLMFDYSFNDNMKLNMKYQLGDDAYTTNYSDVWGYGHANSSGELEKYGYTINELNSLFTANFDWNINKDFHFNILYGNEFVQKKTTQYYEYGNSFNFSGWNNMNNASSYTANEYLYKKRSIGNFGNLSLDYKNMLFLNITGRQDIVSNMPRNNRTFFYPSVSLGFIFTELPSLKNDVLTFGKLRASYAEVGMAGDYYESYFTTPSYGGGFSSGTPMSYPIGSIVAYTPYSVVYDPNLKPQNTKSYELGLDLAFWNGLLNFSYTYSRQNVKDQIFGVPVAGSTGSSELITNGGSVHTNSHEITLGVKPIDKRNIKWDFGVNFTKIDNQVDELATGVESIFLGGFTEPQVRAGIGCTYPVIYGVSYLRNDNGDIVVDAKGLPQTGEEKVIGKVSPDFELGFNTSFELYKFRLSATVDWKNGGQMYAGTMSMLDYYGVSQKSADLRSQDKFLFELPAVKEVTDANGNVSYAPNDIYIDGSNAESYFNALNNVSESFIHGNSFVKLREISLSYPLIEKTGLNLTVNAFARNILLWSELGKGFDPEASQGNTNMVGAFERFSLPGSSTYGLGFTVKF